MKMETEKYFQIVEIIRNYKGLSKDCLVELKHRFQDVPSNTLYSILSTEYQKFMKQHYCKSSKRIEKYYSEYCKAIHKREEPGIILRMSKENNLAPCLIGKLILQKYFEKKNGDADSNSDKSQQNINLYMRNTCLIPDTDLSYEIYLCTMYDDQYSPLVEVIKMSVGQEYELLLERTLKELGLAFRNEEYLRRYGYDKTPDIKMEIPIMIDGVIINWIESKALFGSEELHREYFKNQYFSYWNRFGPGLVIYWFGFVETLIQTDDKRFIIRDNFPKDIADITSLI
ncbi:uncharacterized protein C15orf41 homolog [Agrilus planipennis]|uniref:CDAN1-interacting nuclease 1 n=1 Tax=Agrilus planipennis TaxID=224129 RepID=A0A1W4XGV3_AGRPL|nr:uncharacterized protein C15orf41 homolog [Agrilus planipennis]